MTRRFPLFLSALAACSIGSIPTSQAEEKAASTGSLSLEAIPDAIAKCEDDLQQAADAARTVLETEAAAGRLSDTAAQNLRWTLRSVTVAYAGMDTRGLIATARVPFDNAAVMKALKDMEAVWVSTQARRSDIQKTAFAEAKQRAVDLIHTATTSSQVENLIENVERTREAMSKRTTSNSTYDPNNTFQGLVTQLRNFERFLEAETMADAAALVSAARNMSNSYGQPNLIGDAEVRARLEKIQKPFAESAEQKRIALDEAIAAGKPAATVSDALAAFEEAAGKAAEFRMDMDRRDLSEVTTAYRQIAKALSAAEEGNLAELKQIRSSLESFKTLDPRQTASIRATLGKRETELEQASAKQAQERRDRWKARLLKVSTAAELSDLAMEMQRTGGERYSERGSNGENLQNFAVLLSSLAASWSSGTPMLLQQGRVDYGATNPFPAEVDVLRKRIERDVLARSLNAPELASPPLIDQDIDSAVHTLATNLSRQKDWRRLLRLLEGRQSSERGYLGGGTDIASAIRAFLAGNNFELAEEWAQAVRSYRSVLLCTDELAPITAAADRLKDLKRDHPDAFKEVKEDIGNPPGRGPRFN